MGSSIGTRLAEELKERAALHAEQQQKANQKVADQRASDDAALASLIHRVREESEDFNRHANGLAPLTLTGDSDAGAYTLKNAREVTFVLQTGRLQITIPPSSATVVSAVRLDTKGYVYHHIGPNGTATNRESTEEEMVDGLLRQACGL